MDCLILCIAHRAMVIALGEVYSGVFSVSAVHILEERCDVGAVYLVTTPPVLTEVSIDELDLELQFDIHFLVQLVVALRK